MAQSPLTDGSLSAFQVLDCLEVGAPILKADQVSTTYSVTRNGERQSTELIYRYEEPVFDIDDPASRNLASLIGAQVALNYGPFCERIVFRGDLDASDRQFLQAMLANTAKEIYVKKLLQPNPYLQPQFVLQSVEKRSSYVQAEVEFASTAEASQPGGITTSPDRFAILSSGGKDSLLTHGLLREIECESHPVFINESGRHWFTAVNAYRHFKDSVPNTSRVWTNSDRVFGWMLRQLPFIRSDFHRLRSDEYPIRLWTVAVFLFGALPILRKREVGRLLIGDEYDTTVRASHLGIPHYDGLFDQSRFFDQALSRFFAAKSWGLTQHSLLRPMSEMLIQKTLAKRYPDLLKLQVSCHSAHEREGSMRPCGRCEKCRRIVGMLLAIEVDPSQCGYSGEQIESIKVDLVDRGVHQERIASEHLGWLLHEKGLISEPRLGRVPAERRDLAVQLRFHPERSPISEIPKSIRRAVYEILLSQAEGAVERKSRQWIEFDPLSAPEMKMPYRHDRDPLETRARPGKKASASFLWSELSWPEAKKALQKVDVALLPVGAIEQHGPHLSVDIDAFDAEHLAREVAKACSPPHPLVLPLIPYGVSYHHEDFPGTLSVGNESLARFVYDVGISAARNGIKKLVIINGHGGNSATLHFAAQRINRDANIFTCVDSGETSDVDIYALAETSNDVHAGEIETSTSLAVRPELVDMSKAKAMVPKFSSRYLDFTSKYSVGWYARTERISKSGVFGDPTRASAEKGQRIWEISIRHLVSLVEHLKELSLAEIHQQKI